MQVMIYWTQHIGKHKLTLRHCKNIELERIRNDLTNEGASAIQGVIAGAWGNQERMI